MTTRLLALPLCLFLLNVRSFADDASHHAVALQLVAQLNSKEELVNAFVRGLEPVIQKIAQRGAPEVALKEIREAAYGWFDKAINYDTLAPKVAAMYEKEFSEDELKQFVAFYDTAAGKRLRLGIAKLSHEAAELGAEQFKGKEPELQQQVMAILSKYGPPSGAPPK